MNKLVDVISSSLDAQNNISQLESTCCESNHVTVSTPVSSVNSIPASGIGVVGAGLSGRENDTLLLSISNTDVMPEYDTNSYANTSFFDMRMTSSNGAVSTDLKELDIPATITLPVPGGIDMSKLCVLHFRDDGSADEIKPNINSETRSAKFVITGVQHICFCGIR